ncbi:uncharacterized protein A1O5_08361 [Cladophialophora psammophila CBS 110553]|uniref:Transcription factor domain-containing protein n=1 Tax=Cladophialophora psammophila CBS 110553 TaxID=1182543 RepID=W9WK77_9EURO|nr:uncharacterized protein A1O5_08361 [Cladophialophora psammophila CBS 110553]EXJ68567.1 hypothetical protein A1O5_08361 [Cladophialophora psammophila CBS 110553]
MVEGPYELLSQSADLQLEELELLYCWTMFTSHGFGDKLIDVKAWQLEIPQVACNHPFLMHGILAVSALHKSRAEPETSQQYLVRTVHHQNIALPFYRNIIDDFRKEMTEANCHAVMAFASLIIAFAFADLDAVPASACGVASRSTIPEWIHLLRGGRKVLQVIKSWIIKGPMAFHLRQAEGDINLSRNPDDARLAALEVLFEGQDSSHELPDSEREVYRTTLRLLRQSFAISLSPDQPLGIKFSMFLWIERFPQEYLELLDLRKPEAAILLPHFCLLLERGAASCWYMVGAAGQLVTALYNALGDNWRVWMAWPLQQINPG